jgi:nucleotide-binding universal stress UspA family protein
LSFATLMVCMRVGRSNAGLLAVARDVAARFDSTVIGIAAKQVSTYAASIRGAGPCEPHQHNLRKFAEHAGAAEDEFRKALAGLDKLEWRTKMTFGPAYEHVAAEARIADLVLAPVDGRENVFSPSGQVEIGDLVKNIGRPVLVAPVEATGLKLDEALIVWKETRATRRAVADALPLLKATKRVDVVEIAEPSAIEDSRRRVGDVGDWLARHGIEANCSAEVARGPGCAQLMAMADELRTDLIVAGAYSHSRLHEWAFGDTRDLLSRLRRCVLASH